MHLLRQPHRKSYLLKSEIFSQSAHNFRGRSGEADIRCQRDGEAGSAWCAAGRKVCLLRGLAGHHIFDEADYASDDSASDATANRLPKHRADIDIPGCSLKHR